MLNSKTKLFFPEPLFDLSKISMSTFLYFQEEPISFTSNPTASLYMGGSDPFYFAQMVEDINPKWKNEFHYIFNMWMFNTERFYTTQKILEPIRNKYFNTILLSYSRTEEALEENNYLIKSTGLNEDELFKIIDVPMACDEVISHILFEKFLEIYESKMPDRTLYFKELEEKPFKDSRINVDYKDLFNYCNILFTKNSFKQLLIKSYFYRIKAFKYFPDILLSNNKLTSFLSNLPVDFKAKEDNTSYYEDMDIIAWEIFRQLTSIYIDNIDETKRVELTLKLRSKHNEEIINLKNKCIKLAEQFKGEKNIELLVENISQHIRINTEKEIKELLKLDKSQLEEIINAIFSDEKTWFALGTFLVSTITGVSILVTSGAALAAIANVASKSFKVASETEKKINSSDYALIYRMNNYK
ncbi:MAG: hypothetical protein M0D57_02205 [Sphingobacteriales bacterium JAD_PAG50586_3]|nr:MAG: hypothetical protein M0D57_02205 [Sphingobacteriales bacterium JAD_PAG50586_3]